MENNYPDLSLKGQFIMAMPGLADPNFSHTVTCICEHTSEGAVGIVVNHVHAFLSGKDIFEELGMDYVSGAGSIPIYLGGPVHIGEIFILHGPPFDWDGCRMITRSLAMSNTRDILQEIALDKGPESLIIALGCAGWGPNQLESEIRQNAWLTYPAFEELIFDVAVEERWEEAVRKMGIEPGLLSDMAGHA
ncbi:YqgE/AlgH family protein [Desulfococcaceae bacterium HSG8]|nr:YqgE/AlgH family protein [Desulfococcaceae bacterium HSG8]